MNLKKVLASFILLLPVYFTHAAEEFQFNSDVLSLEDCSGLMIPDTHLGENARHIEVSDDQTTPCVFR